MLINEIFAKTCLCGMVVMKHRAVDETLVRPSTQTGQVKQGRLVQRVLIERRHGDDLWGAILKIR